MLRRRAEAETQLGRGAGRRRGASAAFGDGPRAQGLAREDAELVDGEGGLNREQKGGEPPPPGEGHGEETVGGAEKARAPEVQPEQR